MQNLDKMQESATNSWIESKTNKKVELARIYENDGNFFERLNKDHTKDRVINQNKTREQIIDKMKKGRPTRNEVIEYYEANQERIDKTVTIDPDVVEEDFQNYKKIVPKIDNVYKNPKKEKEVEKEVSQKSSRSLTPLKKSLQVSIDRLSKPRVNKVSK
jgi:hypothetical protein